MAKRTSHRARSRKRRSGASGEAKATRLPGEAKVTLAPAAATADEQPAEPRAERAQGTRQRSRERAAQTPRARSGGRGFRDPMSVGERPQAPWHPLPLSELLILVGGIGAAIALSRGEGTGGAPGPTLIAAVAAVLIGTYEVVQREHLSGYRSHTIMLALVPPILFHTAVVLLVAAFTAVPRLLTVLLLPVDGALFAVGYKLLRARFLDARRERTFTARR